MHNLHNLRYILGICYNVIIMNTAILDRLWISRSYSVARFVTLVTCGVILLTLSAKISVPFFPVPMTLQTFAILMICASGGLHLGISTIATYLVLGAMGVPVFASGAGIAYILGPTGGYLLGFLVAAFLIGVGVRHGYDKKLLPCLAIMAAAVGTIYLCGWLWLGNIIGYEKAWIVGILPFIAGDVLKTFLAVMSIRIIRGVTQQRK